MMGEQPTWSEGDSQAFMEYGRYFVPERERQLATISALIPPVAGQFQVLELACGEGLLAETVLERHPQAVVTGLDGSPGMLARACERLARYETRFLGEEFDLAAATWRTRAVDPLAIVSSLAIHHLDGPEKQTLFADCHRMLAPGGVLIIADLVLIQGETARQLAADSWDAEVEARSLALAGNRAPHAFFQRAGWNMYRTIMPDDIDKPSTLAEQLHWLEQAGFSEVDVYWMLAGHAIFGGRRA